MANKSLIIINGIWWKALGVIIFLYVLIGGMVVPLNPGITGVSPSNAVAGDTITLEITGYNTHFTDARMHNGWLKLDSNHIIKAYSVKPSNQQIIHASFVLPDSFPSKSDVHTLSLILDNETDGVFIQPSALFVSANSEISETGQGRWQNSFDTDFHDRQGLFFPYRSILNETIRNTFFHVALWFAMFILLLIGVVHAVKYLRKGNFDDDIISSSFTAVAVMYGVLGILTGAVWAKFTWNTFWTNDVKLNMTAVALLIYLAYFVLRGMHQDQDRRARFSAGFSIFAFTALIPLVFVIPRLTDSLHPGNGGNPALGGEDLDNTLRMFFYPSIISLTIMGLWMSQLMIRANRLKNKILTR